MKYCYAIHKTTNSLYDSHEIMCYVSSREKARDYMECVLQEEPLVTNFRLQSEIRANREKGYSRSSDTWYPIKRRNDFPIDDILFSGLFKSFYVTKINIE